MTKYVFYVDVGNLPRQKAEEYIAQVRRDYLDNKFFDDKKDNILYIPISDGHYNTRLEIIPE